MSKPHPKPSDRGRNSPEPGPPPGSRAEQRGTASQLEADRPKGGDQAASWEREEQAKLPPRGGEGAQKSEEAGGSEAGRHTGGTRGPSNQNR